MTTYMSCMYVYYIMYTCVCTLPQYVCMHTCKINRTVMIFFIMYVYAYVMYIPHTTYYVYIIMTYNTVQHCVTYSS